MSIAPQLPGSENGGSQSMLPVSPDPELQNLNEGQLTQLDHLRAFFGFLQYFSLLSCAFPSPRSEKMVEWRPSVFP